MTVTPSGSSAGAGSTGVQVRASMAASTAPGSGKGLSPSAPASRAGPSSSVRAEKYPGVPCATFHAQRSARLR